MSAGVFPITLPDQPNEMVFGSPRALSFEPSAHDCLSVRHIEIDFRSFSVQGRSQLIALTRVEFDILAYLVAARRVVSSVSRHRGHQERSPGGQLAGPRAHLTLATETGRGWCRPYQSQ